MTRATLRAIAAMARAHAPLLHFLAPMVLALALCGALGCWLSEHDARVKNDVEHARELHYANSRIEKDSIALALATAQMAQDGVTVTRTHTEYRTVRDTLLLEMERAPAQVAQLLPHLPAFIQRADNAVNACTKYQQSATTVASVAGSLVSAHRDKEELLEHAPVWKPPRWTAEGEVRYEPLTQTPAASGTLALRVAGSVSTIARLDQRFAPGERPRASFGIRIAVN